MNIYQRLDGYENVIKFAFVVCAFCIVTLYFFRPFLGSNSILRVMTGNLHVSVFLRGYLWGIWICIDDGFQGNGKTQFAWDIDLDCFVSFRNEIYCFGDRFYMRCDWDGCLGLGLFCIWNFVRCASSFLWFG